MAEIVWESDAQSSGFTVMSNGMVWPDDWPGTLVEAQFTSARGDGADLDRDPDMVPSGPGRVTFTPLVRTVGYDGEHGKRIVSLHPFEAVVGDDGFLYTPDEYGQPGIRGIALPSNDSAVVDEHDWTWRVTFDIPDTTIRPTHIPTPHDHSVDIKDYLDSDANYGVRVVVDRVAARETLTARDETLQARDEAQGYATTSGGFDSRLGQIEVMAGLAPGEVTDAQTANLITQQDTATRSALDSVFGDTLMVVYHGRDPNYPRPQTNRPVMWIGTVTPVYRIAGDLVPVASSEPAPYTPAELDLIAWWDPSSLVHGANVTTVMDYGPQQIHLTTVGGAGGVTVNGTALAWPGLDNGGTAHMSTDPDAAVGFWDGAVTVYMVASLSDLPTVSNLFDNGSSMSVNRAAFWVNSGGRVGMTQGQTIQSDPYLVTADWPFLLAVTLTGGTDSRAELNGTIVTGPGDAGSNRPDSFRLFANLNGANLAPAVIGETIIARNVTEEQHTDITEYLQTKWELI